MSIERLNNAFTEQDNINKLDVVLDYSQVTAPLAADVIKEAFYSRLYIDATPEKNIAGKPMDANKYLDEMKKARANALLSQNKYLNFINENKETLEQFQILNQHINIIRNLIDKFQYVRNAADEKSHLSKNYTSEFGRDLHTMWEMEVLIKRLVLSLNEIVVISMQNPQLGKLSSAYYNLVAANTEYSFHNSFVYLAIYNARDVYTHTQIYSSFTKNQNYLDTFLSFADEATAKAYNEMRANKYFLMADQIALQARTGIYEQLNKPLKVDASIDWDRTTAEIFDLYQQTMDVALNQLIDTKEALIDDANQRVIETLILMILALVIIAIISYFIGHSITNQLKAMVGSFKLLTTNKDMSIKLDADGKDELSELSAAFNSLLESFNATLGYVKNEAIVINKTTSDVSNAMNESLELSDRQLQATDSISVAINEMTATIEEVSNMALQTSNAVQNAYNIAVKSSDNAALSQQMMEKLTLELGNTSQVVNSLNQETSLIGNVLNVIQGIAEQTNLLALNAAIEAARAGDMGRGFAVVADEVRSLAGRTQESTEQIRYQIEALQKGADAATTNMDNLQSEGAKAVDIVIEGAEAVNIMKTELDNIMQMAEQIATAAEQQTNVSNEINERIHAIKEDADKITSKTNDTASSAEGLKETGGRLNVYISEFKIDEN
ncbi:methyl-accepting chemotaxis protein [Colwellia sp. E2M01]|uniref:methyl-accepting chemotaxis protein n=1 Tax=Colwellia sp. E2M01 TaxID=2841561 RepID=UPI001C089DC5|nr:methyl-accepting chemotaxis protein [Colwellia sp. E2M01]MBU2871857.1 methyl-accepting chemotaxis protein [Colwellia sp. E2M01]